MLSSGILEINLIAQDLAALGTDRKEKDFIKLLGEISKLSGKFWIRLLYIHPDFFPLELLDIVAADKRILPYFDIPSTCAKNSKTITKTKTTTIKPTLFTKDREHLFTESLLTVSLLTSK